jgi:hypothetical protein
MKERVEKSRSRRDRLGGELDSVKKQLKAVGCKNLKEAKELLKKKETKILQLEENIEKKLSEMENEFA